MYKSGNSSSIALKNQLLSKLDPVVPGGQNNWSQDGLAELSNNNLAPYRAYVELFFHTSPSAVNWFQAGGGPNGAANQHSGRYGYAVDSLLGYPR